MSWTRYLLHDFWTAREFNRLDDERRSASRVQRRQSRARLNRQRDLELRVGELEDDLGEAMLMVRTLADLCLSKGLITDEEFAARAEHIDGLDGNLDGRATRPDKGDDTEPRD